MKFSNKDFYFKTNRKYSVITNGDKMNHIKRKEGIKKLIEQIQQ